jgi:hypothetical protein
VHTTDIRCMQTLCLQVAYYLSMTAQEVGGLYNCTVSHGDVRVISDCHFTKTATEYDRKPGIKWLSCTAK